LRQDLRIFGSLAGIPYAKQQKEMADSLESVRFEEEASYLGTASSDQREVIKRKRKRKRER
jgi:hypothetical protein